MGVESTRRGRPSHPAELVDYCARFASAFPGRRILDLAAATGAVTIALAERPTANLMGPWPKGKARYRCEAARWQVRPGGAMDHRGVAVAEVGHPQAVTIRRQNS
ncbi:hypothetical protein [Streptomyces syringium]|uniref:hypothetical protein n=1 Tax=Streptomyces syringium TaxID=76729 RepID=UPI0033C27218